MVIWVLDKVDFSIRIFTISFRIRNAFIFSAPEPKAQVHYCDHALSVVRR